MLPSRLFREFGSGEGKTVMATERQVKANQANALLSTGPRTPEGKAISARNALRHGILAREAVIDDGDGRENLEEYESLLCGLEDSLMPVGEMERLLVERIAVQHWRLRRALRFETGCLRVELDDHRRDAERKARLSEMSTVLPDTIRPKLSRVKYGDPITEAEVQAQNAFRCAFPYGSKGFEGDDRFLEAAFRRKIRTGDDAGDLPEHWRDEAKAFVAKLTDKEKRKLCRDLFRLEDDLSMQMMEVLEWNRMVERRERRLSLPSGDEIEKILRYQTAIERSIARDLDMLMKLQQVRHQRQEDNDGDEAAGPPEAPQVDVQAAEGL
jgi:hypothetical protein